MSIIYYDPEYCPTAPWIYYYRMKDGYIIGGEYTTKKEAEAVKAQIIAEHGEEIDNTWKGWDA